MTGLDRLLLHGTRVTDSGVGLLGGLSNLRDLDLVDTAVTRAAVTKLRATLPKLKVEHDLAPDRPHSVDDRSCEYPGVPGGWQERLRISEHRIALTEVAG